MKKVVFLVLILTAGVLAGFTFTEFAGGKHANSP